MENKKLIEQLEGVGFNNVEKYSEFKTKDFDCTLCADGQFTIHTKDLDTLIIVLREPTFPQIIAAIKKHTGVDLSPKKTKREEIEELKTKVATMQDAIKSQNEAVEQNKKEAHRANDRLTMVLRDLKRLGFWKDEEVDNNPKYFFGMDFGLDAVDALAYSVSQMIRKDVNELIEQGDERILSKLKPIDTSKLKQAFKNMQDMCDKQSPEMQAEEKKGFEAGNRVVLTGVSPCAHKTLRDDEKEGTVFLVSRVKGFSIYLTKNGEIYRNYLGEELDFSTGELEHAPSEPKEKALEWGDRARLKRDYQIGNSCVIVPKDQVVLIAYGVEDSTVFVTTPIGKVGFCIELSLLKPL